MSNYENLDEDFLNYYIIWDSQDGYIVYGLDDLEIATASTWESAVAKFKKYLKDNRANVEEILF